MKLLAGLILFIVSINPSSIFSAEKAEAVQESPIKADPNHPTTLDSRDPSFEDLATKRYKPNANYKIRDFKEGTVQTLSGTLEALDKEAKINLDEISKLQTKAHDMNYTDKEQLVASLADLNKQQQQFISTLTSYKNGKYQTNISAQSLRLELHKLTNEVTNLKNLLGSWQKENKTAWE